MKTIGYHTVEDRENPDHVENNAPFLCVGALAFLGNGYYYWQDDIDLAHWWGQVHCGQEYMICESTIQCDDSVYCDLVGSPSDLRKISALRDTLKQEIMRFNKTDTVALGQIIEFCRRLHSTTKKGLFPWKVIRAVDASPLVDKRFASDLIKFNTERKNFTSLRARIMISLSEKRGLLPDGTKIIHPAKYLIGDSK
jgi:hypothetical protein